MKLYRISVKYGKSPYQIFAYVEADTPSEAKSIYALYLTGKRLEDSILEGYKYKTDLCTFPDNFFDKKEYIRCDFLPKQNELLSETA